MNMAEGREWEKEWEDNGCWWDGLYTLEFSKISNHNDCQFDGPPSWRMGSGYVVFGVGARRPDPPHNLFPLSPLSCRLRKSTTRSNSYWIPDVEPTDYEQNEGHLN